MGLSVASWRKKKRSCGSDKSAHDLGRDKSKNASILRKYGSIWVGEKTRGLLNVTYVWLEIYVTLNNEIISDIIVYVP